MKGLKSFACWPRCRPSPLLASSNNFFYISLTLCYLNTCNTCINIVLTYVFKCALWMQLKMGLFSSYIFGYCQTNKIDCKTIKQHTTLSKQNTVMVHNFVHKTNVINSITDGFENEGYPGCQRFFLCSFRCRLCSIVTHAKNLWSRARFRWERQANDKPV